MKKRFVDFEMLSVKKVLGVAASLTAKTVPCHHGNILRIEDGGGDFIDFTPEQWVTLTERIRVEDVPEPKTPGQRLGEALLAMGFGGVPMQTLELAADSLGIKPEDER